MKKYKLAKEDEHMFHIQHPDGSTFPIAKNAVGPAVHKRIKALEPIKMSAGGEVPEYDQIQTDDPSAGAPQIQQSASPLVIEPATDADIGGSRSPQSVQSPDPAAPQQITGSPVNPMAMNDAYAQAFAQKESGIKDTAGAQAQAGKEQAAAYEQQANQMAAQQAHYEQEHAKLDAEHKQVMDAVMNQKIDPNRLWNNMSTGNKVLAGIGVALSGLGAGLAGRPDLANSGMEVIQKSIDRDIDSQKMDLGKKQTLLSENVRRFGDLNTATQMTRLQMNAVTQAKIAQSAARSGSVQAQANAKVMLGELGLQAAQIKQQATIRQMAMQGGGYDPAVFVPHLVTDPSERPKVFEEIKNAQNVSNNGPKILKAFDDASKENTALQTGAGFLRTPGSVMALHQLMLPNFKSIDGTVRQAAMDESFHNLTPSPGDSAAKIKTKRAALQDWLTSESAAPTAKGYGIDLTKFGSTAHNSAAMPVERVTKDGKVAMFDPGTKRFLGYKQ